jgi:hypothetical protein
MHLSARSHSLLINGPAGFGKTQAVTEALEKAGLPHSRLGSYSTPLHLFNFLHANQGIVVLDDVAGLFYDRAAMGILKAATWAAPNGRIIGWCSTWSRKFRQLGSFATILSRISLMAGSPKRRFSSIFARRAGSE